MEQEERLTDGLAATGPRGDTLTLGGYAQQAYLEYALSVGKGRARPEVCEGEEPGRRRWLYALEGSAWSASTSAGRR